VYTGLFNLPDVKQGFGGDAIELGCLLQRDVLFKPVKRRLECRLPPVPLERVPRLGEKLRRVRVAGSQIMPP